LNGSWGSVDATNATVIAANDVPSPGVSLGVTTLHESRFWDAGPVTVNGALVLADNSELIVGCDAPPCALHVVGDMNVSDTTLKNFYLGVVAHHQLAVQIDGTRTGRFVGVPEGAVIAGGAEGEHWRVSYGDGDGNDVGMTFVAPVATTTTSVTTPPVTILPLPPVGVDATVAAPTSTAVRALPRTGASHSAGLAGFGFVLVIIGAGLAAIAAFAKERVGRKHPAH